mgnify:CR=1 FL=1
MWCLEYRSYYIWTHYRFFTFQSQEKRQLSRKDYRKDLQRKMWVWRKNLSRKTRFEKTDLIHAIARPSQENFDWRGLQSFWNSKMKVKFAEMHDLVTNLFNLIKIIKKTYKARLPSTKENINIMKWFDSWMTVSEQYFSRPKAILLAFDSISRVVQLSFCKLQDPKR